MPFKIKEIAPFPGLAVIEPQAFTDARGFFMEAYSKAAFAEAGIIVDFVQDNVSFSGYGTTRGLHFQAPPYAQAKLVTVLQGKARDIVVDVRVGSPTYGRSYAVELSADNRLLFFVPEGFAHGFSVLSETCLFSYKCSNYYHKPSEGGLFYADEILNLNWGVETPIVSEKDLLLPHWKDFKSLFSF